jgi:putative RNA 2'-phosphotransferase
MISKKQTTQISKFLSLVLRHKPETIGIELDQNGWADVKSLLEKSNKYGLQFDLEMLKYIVETNPKKRFAFDHNFSKIRASQGHSLEIELGYSNQKPPQFLFHGTSEKSVESIWENGIEKQKRQHVHLSSDIDTAIKVGQRHGKPFIFKILAEEMYNDKFEFYISDNNVWLTNFVPKKYLKRNV